MKVDLVLMFRLDPGLDHVLREDSLEEEELVVFLEFIQRLLQRARSACQSKRPPRSSAACKISSSTGAGGSIRLSTPSIPP